ncbi:MAG: hypothetical protein ACR2OI_02780 [Acidimicrobiia bacterium]
MQFVWSDDLAQLLLEQGEASTREVNRWVARPIGYRLPEGESSLSFARHLLDAENNSDERRLAS